MVATENNPALIAAIRAQERVTECLRAGQSFRLEAGAGAGKTYSLIAALKEIIAERGTSMRQTGRKVACITFTEVAREEIAQEIEQHPAILVETIHAFSWSVMAQFQSSLRELISSMDDRREKIAEGGGIGNKTVEYNLGFFGVDENKITLGHDDVPGLMANLLELPKFRQLVTAQFPIIFIDEYQDTDPRFMAAIVRHFLEPRSGPMIGLFGDHWQTIYRSDYLLADFPNTTSIDKGANFRSAPAIVDVLNALRPELPQEVSEPDAEGQVSFFHTNSYSGERMEGAHSKGDLPIDVANICTSKVIERLKSLNWNFSPSTTKILMLTHNALAAKQGYPGIAEVFERKEAFSKKEDPVIGYMADVIEPMADCFVKRRFGDMFRIMGGAPVISSHTEKLAWFNSINGLVELRLRGSVGAVIDYLKQTSRPRLSDKIVRLDDENKKLSSEDATTEISKTLTRYRSLREVTYQEVINLVEYLEGNTPFATQHSVKGAEFENVLVIVGGGWNHYNWPQLFELLASKALTKKNEKGYYRARNLFYVSVSRPKKRLAVLATQALSPAALSSVEMLFGRDNVHAAPA